MDESHTVYCGNLADEVTEELLYELFLQVAPLERVDIPPNREEYAIKLLDGIKLYAKNITIRPRNGRSQPKPFYHQSHHESKINKSMESLSSNQSFEDTLNINKRNRNNGPNNYPTWREKNNYSDNRNYNRRNYSNWDKARNFDHHDNKRGNHSRKPYEKRHHTDTPYGRRNKDF
ncbi:hypothetical protein GWI33_009787 [Rhynchophorus ferrugineus]|uniref:RRM domain-containing protein n=1 Tax=Rhynchophorus ferrugineus TaxID=354439 RepID=A0A834MNK2_RHYFE|nr:hypothetical protein GWI33_009787 [Rhynchophorus ferrugineus]